MEGVGELVKDSPRKTDQSDPLLDCLFSIVKLGADRPTRVEVYPPELLPPPMSLSQLYRLSLALVFPPGR